MHRLLPILLCLLLLPAGLAHAQDKRLQGELTVSDGVVSIATDSGTKRLVGHAAQILKHFPSGWVVEVRGEPDGDLFVASHLISPKRTDVSLVAANEEGERVVRDDKGNRVEATGRESLLPAGRKALADVFHYPATATTPQRVFVVAVEAVTTTSWTLLRTEPKTVSMLTGFVRGEDRAVWLLKEQPGWRYVRRGDWEGWTPTGTVAVGVPFGGSYSGAANALPQ